MIIYLIKLSYLIKLLQLKMNNNSIWKFGKKYMRESYLYRDPCNLHDASPVQSTKSLARLKIEQEEEKRIKERKKK